MLAGHISGDFLRFLLDFARVFPGDRSEAPVWPPPIPVPELIPGHCGAYHLPAGAVQREYPPARQSSRYPEGPLQPPCWSKPITKQGLDSVGLVQGSRWVNLTPSDRDNAQSGYSHESYTATTPTARQALLLTYLTRRW